MTSLIVIIIIGAMLAGVWHRLQSGVQTGDKVTWSSSIRCVLPLDVVRPALARHLRDLRWEFVSGDYVSDGFRRGERTLTRPPGRHDDHWLMLPLILAACFDEADGQSVVILRFTSLRWVKYRDADIRFFHELAEVEFKGIKYFLDQFTRRYGDQRDRTHAGNGRRPNHRWYPDDEEAESTHQPSPDGSLDADLASLGLKRGASWEEVQRAYRAACRKYHPDRLNGAGIEPYLVELAVQRFKEVSAAYRRLRDRMAKSV